MSGICRLPSRQRSVWPLDFHTSTSDHTDPLLSISSQASIKVCHQCLHCQVVGASGVVFGLMGLYAGDVLLNFRSLTLPWLRLLWVTASCIYFIVSSVLQVRQPVWLGWSRLAVRLLW